MPFQREELESYGAVFHLSSKPTRISKNIMTSGEIPAVTDFENSEPGKSNRFIKEVTGLKDDQMLDDQAIFINTPQGLVVITGCAHRGLINTLYHARKITGSNKIYAVFGGSHLIDASEERRWKTIEALKEMDVQKLGLCHCTGLPAISLMMHEFKDRFILSNAGSAIVLP